MKTAVVIGAGMRGGRAYGPYALANPDEIRIVAVAEPDHERQMAFAQAHGIPPEMRFLSWEDLLREPRLADAAIICTQDGMHFDPTMQAIEKGYHILLEKPMSPDPSECIRMGDYANQRGQHFAICHVLRYTAFFGQLKQLLEERRIGQLISIQLTENVGYFHFAHSFVRGNWRNSKLSSPMILAKSCHDMDILLWLAGGACRKVSSFGTLTHFTPENAPEGAPNRCTDGCPAAQTCPYFAPHVYLVDEQSFMTASISNDPSIAAREQALRDGPYGRCVYRCDNDVVDHQVVNLMFENDVTASFTMCGFTHEINRTLKLMGTKGEIRGNMAKNELEIYDFLTGTCELIHTEGESGDNGHGGGDEGIMRAFVKLLGGDVGENLTSADVSVQSHLIAFAAERARLENSVIDLPTFRKEMASELHQ